MIPIPPTPDTRPLDLAQLSHGQRHALEQVQAVLLGMMNERGMASSGDTLWASPDPARSHRVLLFSGERRAGKTTVLLTLLKAWRDVQQGKAVAPEFDGDLAAGVRAIRPLDFHPLPKGQPLRVWLVEALRPIVDDLMKRAAQPTEPWSSSTPDLRTHWDRTVRSAVVGWHWPNSRGELQEKVLDVQDRTQGQRRLVPLWRELIDRVLAGLQKWHSLPASGLLVISIDDLDLEFERAEELLQAMRLLHHPGVVFLLTGHWEHLKEAVLLVEQGRRRAVAHTDQTGEHVEDIAQSRAEKVLPPRHVIRIAGPTLRELDGPAFGGVLDRIRGGDFGRALLELPADHALHGASVGTIGSVLRSIEAPDAADRVLTSLLQGLQLPLHVRNGIVRATDANRVLVRTVLRRVPGPKLGRRLILRLPQAYMAAGGSSYLSDAALELLELLCREPEWAADIQVLAPPGALVQGVGPNADLAWPVPPGWGLSETRAWQRRLGNRALERPQEVLQAWLAIWTSGGASAEFGDARQISMLKPSGPAFSKLGLLLGKAYGLDAGAMLWLADLLRNQASVSEEWQEGLKETLDAADKPYVLGRGAPRLMVTSARWNASYNAGLLLDAGSFNWALMNRQFKLNELIERFGLEHLYLTLGNHFLHDGQDGPAIFAASPGFRWAGGAAEVRGEAPEVGREGWVWRQTRWGLFQHGEHQHEGALYLLAVLQTLTTDLFPAAPGWDQVTISHPAPITAPNGSSILWPNWAGVMDHEVLASAWRGVVTEVGRSGLHPRELARWSIVALIEIVTSHARAPRQEPLRPNYRASPPLTQAAVELNRALELATQSVEAEGREPLIEWLDMVRKVATPLFESTDDHEE